MSSVTLCFQNPSKPHFNHYLFESLCLSIRITCKANPATVSSFEEALFPVFTEILQSDVQGRQPCTSQIFALLNTMLNILYICNHSCYDVNVFCPRLSPPPPAEFVPYVFQVMSLLLEIHSNSIPESYMALFPHLLQPVLWERTGNIPPLVRLLQAYLQKGGATIANSAADKIVR